MAFRNEVNGARGVSVVAHERFAIQQLQVRQRAVMQSFESTFAVTGQRLQVGAVAKQQEILVVNRPDIQRCEGAYAKQ